MYGGTASYACEHGRPECGAVVVERGGVVGRTRIHPNPSVPVVFALPVDAGVSRGNLQQSGRRREEMRETTATAQAAAAYCVVVVGARGGLAETGADVRGVRRH